MTDIVERLRDHVRAVPPDELITAHISLITEAATELERQRRLLAATERDLQMALAALDHHLRHDR